MADNKQKEDNEAQESLNEKPENDTDMLETVLYHLGEMGLYQKLMFLGLCPIGVFFAWIYFVQMFITVAPQSHWCRVPQLANLSMEMRRNLSAPLTATGDYDRCMTFDTNWTQVLETLVPPGEGTPIVPCQHGWEFDFSDIPYETVATEREWVCDRSSYVPTAQSMFFAGSLFGGVLLGWIADRFGRVPALLVANLIGGIGGVATIFTSGVWDFIFCRFFVGMAYDNCFMMLYILTLEYVGPKHRTWVATMCFAIFFGSGCVSLPWIALWVGDWRNLLWVTSLPMFIVLLAPWTLPESARWGRRHLTWCPLALTGVLVFIAILVPKGIPQATLAVAARFFINMAFTAVVQWGTEILPTGFRASGSSALHMSGYVASITSPFIVYSERLWSSLPLVIMCATAMLAAAISLTLPETSGQPMPQTVADGEKIIREQSLCGKPEDADEGPYKKERV